MVVLSKMLHVYRRAHGRPRMLLQPAANRKSFFLRNSHSLPVKTFLLPLLIPALGLAALDLVDLEPRQRSRRTCALIAEAVDEAPEYGSDLNILGTKAVD